MWKFQKSNCDAIDRTPTVQRLFILLNISIDYRRFIVLLKRSSMTVLKSSGLRST